MRDCSGIDNDPGLVGVAGSNVCQSPRSLELKNLVGQERDQPEKGFENEIRLKC